MNEHTSFSDLVASVQEDGDYYWQERCKLVFAKDIASLMAEKNVSKTDLARKLNVSPAHITQSLRGDKNLQIETMVSMARAVGGELHLRVHDQAHTAHFFAAIEGGKKRDFSPIPAGTVISTSNPNAKASAVA